MLKHCEGDEEYAKKLSASEDFAPDITKENTASEWKVYKKPGKCNNATKQFYCNQPTNDNVDQVERHHL